VSNDVPKFGVVSEFYDLLGSVLPEVCDLLPEVCDLLGVLFAALFPMLPHYFGLADRSVWAVSSGFVVVLIVCHIVFMSPRFLRAIRHRSWVRLLALEIPLQFAFLIALLSQLLNALGVGLQQSVGGFLLGLYCLLLVATLNFAYLIYVLVRPEDESPA
jgi:hypothetical protein